MSKYRIKMDGRMYEMEIELIEKGSPKGRAKSIADDSNNKNEKPSIEERKKDTATEKESPENFSPITENSVTSPMPGNVLQLCVAVGQTVKEGDTVLVLETMKMENEIGAPRDGIIKKFYVQEGQTVSSDAPLFELEG